LISEVWKVANFVILVMESNGKKFGLITSGRLSMSIHFFQKLPI
jgi:hypothetical protein